MNKYISAICIAALMIPAGCDTNDDAALNPEQRELRSINLTLPGTDSGTRAIMDGPAVTGFEAGDAVTLTHYILGTKKTTDITAVDDAGAITWPLTATPVYYDVAAGITVAYAAGTDAVVNEGEATEYRTYADLLTADAVIDADGDLTAELEHSRALIVIGSFRHGETGADLSVGATVTPKLTDADGNEFILQPIRKAAGGTSPFSWIAPVDGAKLVSLTINDGIETWADIAVTGGSAAADGVALEAGRKYSIKISLSPEQTDVSLAGVGYWTEQKTQAITAGKGSKYTLVISTPEELKAFLEDIHSNTSTLRTEIIVQVADIDMAAYPIVSNSSSSLKSFMGTYNGGGHTISNLKVTASASGKAAMFPELNNALLYNIHLRDCEMKSTTGSEAAPLTTRATTATITACSATGLAEGNSGTGLLGTMIFSNITRCTTSVTVKASDWGSGSGFMSSSDVSTVTTACAALGNVSTTGMGTLSGFCDTNETNIYFGYNGTNISSFKRAGIGSEHFCLTVGTALNSWDKTASSTAPNDPRNMSLIQVLDTDDGTPYGNIVPKGVVFYADKMWKADDTPDLSYLTADHVDGTLNGTIAGWTPGYEEETEVIVVGREQRLAPPY